LYHGLEVVGIRNGYQGLIDGDMYVMKSTDVSGILQRGGTVLKTARCAAFTTAEGRAAAHRQVLAQGIDGLVLLGGDGTFRGAGAFYEEYRIPSAGVPCTIDKDLIGTDTTIGYDTAVNTAVDAIDKIKDTAEAHSRIFVIEVMGRDAGYIALNSGLACGAEDILIPEAEERMEEVICKIDFNGRRHKNVHLIVVAEGDELGGGKAVLDTIKKQLPDRDVRLCVLGHIQRGGSPSQADRVLASRLGYGAVMALINGDTQVMAGMVNGNIQYTPFSQVVKGTTPIPEDMLAMMKALTG
jgi:6-phosphofructokinase 1